MAAILQKTFGNAFFMNDNLSIKFQIKFHWNMFLVILLSMYDKSRVSCQKGPTRHAYAWQMGPFWQHTLDFSQCWWIFID